MMKIQIVFWTFCLALVCAIGHGAEIANGEWTVEVTPSAANKLKGTTKPYTDVLTVKDGQLSSKVAGQQGFKPGKCEVKTEQGRTKAIAESDGGEHGKNRYELEFQQGGLSGTLVWSKMGEDGKPKQADFTFKQKQK